MGYTPITRLYVTDDLAKGSVLSLDRDQSHYLVTVMRKGGDDEIALFNGRDGEWRARLIDANRKKAILELVDLRRAQAPEPNVTLAFAPIKSARIDFIAQKACELGAANLTPILTRRTIVSKVRTDRLAANAIEAAEQSERLTIPKVEEPVRLDRWLAGLDDSDKIVFCDEDLSGQPAHQRLAGEPKGDRWFILIGPEGGFTDEERDAIMQRPGTVTITLGPRILRADTAAIAALALWQSALGDWQ